MPKINGKIIKKELVAEETYLFGVEIESYLSPRAGSFFSFRVADKIFRSYSTVFTQNRDIKDSPSFTKDIALKKEDNTILYFLIATKGEGFGANFFRNIEIDQEINAIGPAGKFGLSGDLIKPKIFVGTGTGLSPFVGMSHELFDNGFKKSDLIILAGLKGSDGNWIKEILPDGINLMSCFYPDKTSLDNNESNETVTDRIKILFESGQIKDYSEFYLCGHPAMVSDVEQYLLNCGKNFEIYKEKFTI